jgi:hypothetical protein
LLVPKACDWWAVGVILMLELGVGALVLRCSSHSCWGLRHKLGLARGASFAYARHALIENPAIGAAGISVRVDNAFFAAGQVALIAFAA